jgi:aerobic-type carbon monoxide dehydrogenase small subunit (CoxS/CutS family)
MNGSTPRDGSELSRRSFLKTFGASAGVAATAQAEAVAAELAKANSEKIHGPGTVPITLQVNGQRVKMEVEPRVTLLDALRNYLKLTGSKEVCDRGTCGACSIFLGDKLAYSCSILAIDAQAAKITTIEGLSKDGKLTPVQKAFVEQDALMCGYCTPGFVMSVTALLKKTPHPTAAQVHKACSGNLCRCGTHPRIMQAALKAAGVSDQKKAEVIPYARLA